MSQARRRGAPGAATRGLAARAVERVLGGRTLDDGLASLDLASLGAADRAQVKALAFGTLRWHHRHRRLLTLLLDRPLSRDAVLIEALLSVGMLQLLDDRRPDYAAVSATVDAARWLGRAGAAGLVNATLRRLQREREVLLEQAEAQPEARFSHPAWFIERLHRDWPHAWETVLAAAQRPPPLWLRVNGARIRAPEFVARLAEAGIAAGPGSLPEAVRLDTPLPVAEVPGFSSGDVSVQDLASQLAAHLLAPEPGMRLLDACAAPGGKACHLLERAGGRLDLVALDNDATRLVRLRENLVRLDLGAEVVVGDALRPREWWDGRTFDRILIDAPCSGTGVIRRHPDIKFLRRETDVGPLAARQLAMLHSVWPLLSPGGVLLYATCSVLREENDQVVARFLETQDEAALAAPPSALPEWAVPVAEGGWQTLPGAADTDGLYYALMIRRPA